MHISRLSLRSLVRNQATTYLEGALLRHKLGILGIPLLLQREQSLLETLLVHLSPSDGTGGLMGEVVGEARAEQVDGTMTKTNSADSVRLIEVDMRGCEERWEHLLKMLGGGGVGLGGTGGCGIRHDV